MINFIITIKILIFKIINIMYKVILIIYIQFDYEYNILKNIYCDKNGLIYRNYLSLKVLRFFIF